MAEDVDQKDKAILAVLRNNAKAAVQEIAALTHVPPTTVHQRIKRMEENGVIRGYKAIIDDAALGLHAHAMVFVNGQPQIVAQLRSMEAVKRVVAVIGEFDYLVEISCVCIEDIHIALRYLRRIDGVQNVQSFMVLEQH